MPENRVAWGHALTGIGLLVRRASVPVAFVAPVLLWLTAPPQPYSVHPTWLLAAPAALFLACRICAIAVGALGWIVFPPMHRNLLAETASYSQAQG